MQSERPKPLDTAAAIEVAELRETLRAFLRESELIAQKNGLTPQRHLLLLMIKGARDGSESATVGELATRLRLAQTTVTDLVARAEQAGLVRRESSKTDARVAILRLTAEGERRLTYSVHDHANERKRLQRMLRNLDETLAELRQRAKPRFSLEPGLASLEHPDALAREHGVEVTRRTLS